VLTSVEDFAPPDPILSKSAASFPEKVSMDPVVTISTITCNNYIWKGIYYMTKKSYYSGNHALRIIQRLATSPMESLIGERPCVY
jgi:hypothetical protein